MGNINNVVVARHWPGQKSGNGQHAIGDGAEDTDNASHTIPGAVACRTGMRPVAHPDEATVGSSDVLAVASFAFPECEMLIVQLANGDVIARPNPA